MAKKKTEAQKPPKVNTWKIIDSQVQLIRDQFVRHQNELAPLQRYHSVDQQMLLNTFRNELGIPPELELTLDFETLTFIDKDALQHNNVDSP
jgi:hypothetical protein